ncbi:hypothetical protein FKM82_029413, partial [Ascaphus truei]
MDINVTGVWERNVTGRGVTVVVVDDGVQHTIKDIQPNYVEHVTVRVCVSMAVSLPRYDGRVSPSVRWPCVSLLPPPQYEDHHAAWETNGAGFSHSHQHGFGLLNAWRLTNAAKIWESVPYLASYLSPVFKENRKVPLFPSRLELNWN